MLEYILKFVPDASSTPRSPATPSAPTARSSRSTCRASTATCTTAASTSRRIKELARRWFPRVYFNAPQKHGGHRALADILESIRELDYYRRAGFVAEPGPDHRRRQAISKAVVDEWAPRL